MLGGVVFYSVDVLGEVDIVGIVGMDGGSFCLYVWLYVLFFDGVWIGVGVGWCLVLLVGMGLVDGYV